MTWNIHPSSSLEHPGKRLVGQKIIKSWRPPCSLLYPSFNILAVTGSVVLLVLGCWCCSTILVQRRGRWGHSSSGLGCSSQASSSSLCNVNKKTRASLLTQFVIYFQETFPSPSIKIPKNVESLRGIIPREGNRTKLIFMIRGSSSILLSRFWS